MQYRCEIRLLIQLKLFMKMPNEWMEIQNLQLGFLCFEIADKMFLEFFTLYIHGLFLKDEQETSTFYARIALRL